MDRHKTAPSVPDPKGTKENTRDTLALCVFAGLVVALLVSGYFALKSVDTDFAFRPDTHLREWASGVEERVKGLLGETVKGIKIPGRESAEAKSYLQKGYTLHGKKKYKEALAEFNKALEINPRNAEAYYWRGRTLVNLGKLDQAEGDFKAAVKLRPDYAEAYDNLGLLASVAGRVDEGIAHLTKSVELKPENARAFYHRSRLFFLKGDVASAMRDAEKACSLGDQDGCKAYETYRSGSKEGG